MRLFGRQWFLKYQRWLLLLANTSIGRRLLCIHGDRSGVGKNRIERIMPHFIQWRNGDGQVVYEFRTHEKFGKRLYYGLRPLWAVLHGIDWLCRPVFNFGFDTYTFYPDAYPETTTLDGEVRAIDDPSTGATWANMRAGNVLYKFAGSGDATESVYARTASTSGWYMLFRIIMLFDTSSIEGTLSSAVFNFYVVSKGDELEVDPDINIYSSNPASNIDLVGNDFTTTGTTAFSTAKGYAEISTSAYASFSLNAAGLAAIDINGISKFSICNANYDVANIEPAWSSYEYYFFNVRTSEYEGTSQDPYLTVNTQAAPTLDTASATDITTTTATGNGEILDTGGANATVRGVCWSVSANPTTADSHTTEAGSFGAGQFTASITGLSATTEYHYRAYATNPTDTAYGDDVTFTTAVPNTPGITTLTPRDTKKKSITLGGNITSVGTGVTTFGIAYGSTANPTISGTTVSVSGTFVKGEYYVTVPGLTANTVYHFRPFATCSEGTSYGTNMQFRTKKASIEIEDGS